MACCVPLCRSRRWKAGPSQRVTLHEMPSDFALRDRWLQAINRDDWVPSSYTMVCSLHFLDSDFAEGKRRRLKKGAIPSVFTSAQPLLIGKIRDTIRRKCSDPDGAAPPEKIPCLDTGDAEVSDGLTSTPVDSVPPVSPKNVEDSKESPGIFGTPVIVSDTSNRRVVEVASSVPRQPTVSFTVDRATQVDVRKGQDPERRKRVRRIKDLEDRVEMLKNTVASYKEDLREVMEDMGVATFLSIREEAKEKKVAAMFLVDQVENYHRKCPRWTEDTVLRCVQLRDVSARAYEHIRSEGLLKLPSRNILKKHVAEAALGQAGVDSLLETEPEVQREEGSVEDLLSQC